MGYYTTYFLTVTPDDQAEEINKAGSKEFHYALRYDAGAHEWEPSEQTKWYDREDEMRALSRQFPGVLFTLKGEGEDTGDLWNLYVKDGKAFCAKAQIIIEPYDESKLV
jgi:hypothetical protein